MHTTKDPPAQQSCVLESTHQLVYLPLPLGSGGLLRLKRCARQIPTKILRVNYIIYLPTGAAQEAVIE